MGEALGMSSSTSMAALAADNVLCIFYFATLYWLARGIGPEKERTQESDHTAEKQGNRLQGIDVSTNYRPEGCSCKLWVWLVSEQLCLNTL